MRLYCDIAYQGFDIEILDQGIGDMFYKIKYRVMWELRSLEHELDECGGVMVINKEGNFEYAGFPADLLEKTLAIINSINWDKW